MPILCVSVEKKKKDITNETLKPIITKANSKLDKELQELEVESTKDGVDSANNFDFQKRAL